MSYKLREVTLPLLPKGHEEIRVLHFSDLHLTPKRKTEIADIKSFADLKPDLVISTGDFLAHRDAVPVVLDALAGLFDIPGLFVFGSNDYYEPVFKNPFRYLLMDDGDRKHGPELPWRGLSQSLTQLGWIDLNQSKTTLKIKDTVIEARGTDDAHLNRDDYSKVAGKPKNCDFSIAVTHAPYMRLINAMSKDGIDLIFAGHTHGGQVRLPWFGESKALTTNCDLPRWRSRGATQDENQSWLHVSAGMGTSPFARIRLASPPEVSLITLTSK